MLLKQYCAALESLDPQTVKEVYPDASLDSYRRIFEPYKSLRCVMEEPRFIQLDGVKGTAQVEVVVKQTLEDRRGGAPEVRDVITTMTLSRPAERSQWRIAKLQSVPKP